MIIVSWGKGTTLRLTEQQQKNTLNKVIILITCWSNQPDCYWQEVVLFIDCVQVNVDANAFSEVSFGTLALNLAAAWQDQQKDLCAQQRIRSACASAQSDQSSLSACRSLGSLATHWAHSEDSDQTVRMPRLIWVFAWRTGNFVGFVVLWLNYLIR